MPDKTSNHYLILILDLRRILSPPTEDTPGNEATELSTKRNFRLTSTKARHWVRLSGS